MAYKAHCAIKSCVYEKVDKDFDKLADALALHYRRIHKLTRVQKWGEWSLVEDPVPESKKKAVK